MFFSALIKLVQISVLSPVCQPKLVVTLNLLTQTFMVLRIGDDSFLTKLAPHHRETNVNKQTLADLTTLVREISTRATLGEKEADSQDRLEAFKETNLVGLEVDFQDKMAVSRVTSLVDFKATNLEDFRVTSLVAHRVTDSRETNLEETNSRVTNSREINSRVASSREINSTVTSLVDSSRGTQTLELN